MPYNNGEKEVLMQTLEYKIPTQNKVEKKFFVISDLHIAREKDLEKLDKIIYQLSKTAGLSGRRYDAIFVVGDIIDATNALRSPKIVRKLLNFLRELGQTAPTFLAIGNHDLCYSYKTRWKPRYFRPDPYYLQEHILDEAWNYEGIEILDNETYELDDDYTISVYNPPLEYMSDAPDGNDSYLERKEIKQYAFLKKLDQNKVNILLCHYPNVIKFLHKTNYLKKIDLAIAGHNHHGMTQFLHMDAILDFLRLPNRGIITPGKSFKPKDTRKMRGLMKLDDTTHLLINPAVTSLSWNTRPLCILNPLFYSGSSAVSLVTISNKPVKEKKKKKIYKEKGETHMEYIVELLLEVVIEGSIAGSTNDKFPMAIRIILGTIVVLFFLSVTIGLIVLGFVFSKQHKICLLISLIGFIMLGFSLGKIYDLYIGNKKEKQSDDSQF